MGPLFIVLFFPLNVYTGLLLWRVKMVKPTGLRYKDVGQIVSGRHLAHFAALVVYLQVFLTISDYLLVLGEALGMIFYDSYICKREWILISMLMVLPFAQIRLLNGTRGLLWVNMMAILGAISVSLGYMIYLGTDETITPGKGTEIVPAALTFLTFSKAFSKIAFAYAGQFLYLEFMAEMKNPNDFPKTFWLSGPYQVGVYVIAACVGYAYKGQEAFGLMINYIPFNGWLRFGAILLFGHMIVTYLIKATVLARAVHGALSPARVNDTGRRGRLEWFGITSGVMILCYVVAATIPFFDSLTGLIGASLVPVGCWNLPIWFFWKSGITIPNREKPVLILIFLLGIVLTGVGTYSNMKDIVDGWAANGPPFSCGCEGIWNTCACSSTHTGLTC